MSLSTTASRPLRSSLPAGALEPAVAVLGGEADQRSDPGRRRRGERGEHVGRRLQLERPSPSRPPSRSSRRPPTPAGSRRRPRPSAARRIEGRPRGQPPRARRRSRPSTVPAEACQRHVRRDQRDVRPARRGLLRQRHAHPPGRAVADVADRVDRLARAAGGDQHPQAVERPRAKTGAEPGSRPRPRPGSPPARPAGPPPTRPCEASGPVPGGDDRGAAQPQRLDVSRVAGWSHMWLFIAGRDHERRRAGERGAGEQVVGVARRRAWRACWRTPARSAKASQRDDQLEVGDRVVVGRGLAREGAAGGVGLELVDQHRARRSPPRRSPGRRNSGSRASGRPAPRARPWWPAAPARRPCRPRCHRRRRAAGGPWLSAFDRDLQRVEDQV